MLRSQKNRSLPCRRQLGAPFRCSLCIGAHDTPATASLSLDNLATTPTAAYQRTYDLCRQKRVSRHKSFGDKIRQTPSRVSRDATRSALPRDALNSFPANALRHSIAILSPKRRSATEFPTRQYSLLSWASPLLHSHRFLDVGRSGNPLLHAGMFAHMHCLLVRLQRSVLDSRLHLRHLRPEEEDQTRVVDP